MPCRGSDAIGQRQAYNGVQQIARIHQLDRVDNFQLTKKLSSSLRQALLNVGMCLTEVACVLLSLIVRIAQPLKKRLCLVQALLPLS